MSSSGSIVKLNIGGTLFQTSESTLTRFDGFFKTILETGVPVAKDESGAIFIDRDPTHFRLILKFMRDGHVALPDSNGDIRELMEEAQYYLLTGLVELCENVLEMRGNIVKLNIGGTFFEAPKSTLTQFGFFKNLLETKNPVTKDASDGFFINRDPKHFRLILNFMRDGRVDIPTSEDDLHQLLKEAQYYLLVGLVELCNKKILAVKSEAKPPTVPMYPNIIKFNLRGTLFQTNKSTLTNIGNWFKERIEMNLPIQRDDSGVIFIDRPAKHFNKILDFMTAKIFHVPTSQQEIQEILNEARVYQLEGLVKLCENNLKFRFIESDSQLVHFFENSEKPLLIFHYVINTWNKVFGKKHPNETNDSMDALLDQYKSMFDIYFKPSKDERSWSYSILDKNYNSHSLPQTFSIEHSYFMSQIRGGIECFIADKLRPFYH